MIALNESLKIIPASRDTQLLFSKGGPDAMLFVKLSNLVH